MLKALHGVSENESERALASLTEFLLPSPAPEGKRLTPLQEAILAELRQKLGLSARDDSPTAVAKILDLLASEISSIALAGDIADKTKERLGARGDLPSSFYQVEFGDTFDLFETKRGLSRTKVEEAVLDPSRVEQLLPHRTEEDEALLLFSKEFGQGSARRRLLVQCTRIGSIQHVHAAWVLYYTDIGLMGPESPLESLKKFVDKYGVMFRIGNLPELRKFVLHEAFLIRQTNSAVPLVTFEPDTHPRMSKIQAPFLTRESGLGVIEIAIAYAIDATRHASDLRKHK